MPQARGVTAALVLLAAAMAAPGSAQKPARVPIDLGLDQPVAAPPRQIDLLLPPAADAAPTPAMLKECEDQREAGVVAGEIVVCRQLEDGSVHLFSVTREAWLKSYAESTQNAGTIPTPDVAGEGIFRGPATIGGLCFIPPCPGARPLVVDVRSIPMPPAGSDAERVAQGLAPIEDDDAPLSEETRRRISEELGLPPPPPAGTAPDPPASGETGGAGQDEAEGPAGRP